MKGTPTKKILNRFLNKVDNHDQCNDCWIWTGAKNQKRYGFFKVGSKNQSAHRASWWLFNDDIPDNLQVCHSCDNPSCVNPEHLWLGSNDDNQRDKAKKGRADKKLSNEDAAKIKNLINKNVFDTSIAMEFSVSRELIRDIRVGKIRKQV